MVAVGGWLCWSLVALLLIAVAVAAKVPVVAVVVVDERTNE